MPRRYREPARGGVVEPGARSARAAPAYIQPGFAKPRKSFSIAHPAPSPALSEYRLVAKKGEGTFSEVLKAQCIKNGKYVAIKCMKNHFDSLDQVNNLREIQALRRLSPHSNIIKLLEVLYDQPTGRLALVFELMDMNIYELIRGRRHYVNEDRVKTYMYQLIKSMDHMHRNGIFHRDIKPENILIMDDQLETRGLSGRCRGIYSKQPYTEYISTRWYRAPECSADGRVLQLQDGHVGRGVRVLRDGVSVPAVPRERTSWTRSRRSTASSARRGRSCWQKMKQQDAAHGLQLYRKPPVSGIEKLIPHCAPGVRRPDHTKLLAYDPDDRLSARQALRHPYFREIREMEKRQHALLHPGLHAKGGGAEQEGRGAGSTHAQHGSSGPNSDAASSGARSRRARGSVKASASVMDDRSEREERREERHERRAERERERERGVAAAARKSHHGLYGGGGSVVSGVSHGSHARTSSIHYGGAGAASVVSGGDISVGGVSGVSGRAYDASNLAQGLAGIGVGSKSKAGGGASKTSTYGSYKGGYQKSTTTTSSRVSNSLKPSVGGVGGQKAPVGQREKGKYVSPYGQRRS